MQKYKSFIWAVGLLATIFVTITLANNLFSSDKTNEVKSARELVYNSSFDSSVSQVKDWMQQNMHDPSSLEFVEWSEVRKTAQGNFYVRCKYRANNSQGVKLLKNDVFFLNPQGAYIYHTAFEPK